MSQHGAGSLQGLLLGGVEAQFDDGLDAVFIDHAGRTDADVMKTVLAGHEGRDDEDGTLVARDGLADADRAGRDCEARVAFEGDNLRPARRTLPRSSSGD